jgi:rhodanese-related sulfurtransferase
MVHSITPLEARELVARGAVELVDVREADEWTHGHVPGARHVPLARVRSNPSEELGNGGIIFVCAAGVRSETAARLAIASGIENIYSLSGGTRGWVRAGLPLVRD